MSCRGIGVIGEQPVILPRTGFEYSSACPLTTPSGRMVSFDDFGFLVGDVTHDALDAFDCCSHDPAIKVKKGRKSVLLLDPVL